MTSNDITWTTRVVSITSRSVGAMDNNAYLVRCRVTGAVLLVDAAAEAPRLLALLDGVRPDLVVTTHRHHDHHGALAEVVAATGAPTAAGADDAAAITVTTGVAPDAELRHGETIELGRLTVDVLALRGHTPGSIALAITSPGEATHLITGDSLFPGGVGNTDRDPARFGQLFTDVSRRVFDVYDDGTVVLPGHGRATTVGAERPHLDEWLARGW